MSDQSVIQGNLALVRRRIEIAAIDCGRKAGDITLVAVSKMHPAPAVEAALDCGQFVFGENRVQEAAGKFPALRTQWPQLRLHIIGPLQTNKVRQALDVADVIETLDRPKLAHALAEEFQRQGKGCQLFIQVNTGEEPQKAGVLPGEADQFIEACRKDYGLSITGLMCIPPAEDHPAPHFALLREIARRHGLTNLSMGMSGDYEIAIQFGATHIRVGTAIFGIRPKA